MWDEWEALLNFMKMAGFFEEQGAEEEQEEVECQKGSAFEPNSCSSPLSEFSWFRFSRLQSFALSVPPSDNVVGLISALGSFSAHKRALLAFGRAEVRECDEAL